MFEISVRRVHEPREKSNVGDKQETVDLIEGDVECRSNDSITVSSTWELTSLKMRYSQGDEVNTSLLRVSYCTYVLLCLGLCSLVLPTARPCAARNDNNKDDMCTPTIPAWLKCPPPSKTISLITWFEAEPTDCNKENRPQHIEFKVFAFRECFLSWCVEVKNPDQGCTHWCVRLFEYLKYLPRTARKGQ